MKRKTLFRLLATASVLGNFFLAGILAAESDFYMMAVHLGTGCVPLMIIFDRINHQAI